MSKKKCLVVDDEELARTLIANYISKLDFLELVGSFESAVDAMETLRTNPIDVIFLDIQMPEIKGTAFAKLIPAATQVIFTTAYSEYALEGFELNALDYLLKPITFERFLGAVNRIKPTTLVGPDTAFTIKSGYDLNKVKYAEIQYIESDGEYVLFFTTTQKIMSYNSLKTLEKTLPASMFMRVHRSYIVNRAAVTSLKGRALLISDKEIPVSDRYYETVKKELF